jgi:hypothetical protein
MSKKIKAATNDTLTKNNPNAPASGSCELAASSIRQSSNITRSKAGTVNFRDEKPLVAQSMPPPIPTTRGKINDKSASCSNFSAPPA